MYVEIWKRKIFLGGGIHDASFLQLYLCFWHFTSVLF